uniref:Uncharacterized protein n=1 Tax=Caenorhabditis tropicalis TaxID=1561998 RepID=A0A1I7V3F0_9PELO
MNGNHQFPPTFMDMLVAQLCGQGQGQPQRPYHRAPIPGFFPAQLRAPFPPTPAAPSTSFHGFQAPSHVPASTQGPPAPIFSSVPGQFSGHAPIAPNTASAPFSAPTLPIAAPSSSNPLYADPLSEPPHFPLLQNRSRDGQIAQMARLPAGLLQAMFPMVFGRTGGAADEVQAPCHNGPSGLQAPQPSFIKEELTQDRTQPGSSGSQAPQSSSDEDFLEIAYFKNFNEGCEEFHHGNGRKTVMIMRPESEQTQERIEELEQLRKQHACGNNGKWTGISGPVGPMKHQRPAPVEKPLTKEEWLRQELERIAKQLANEQNQRMLDNKASTREAQKNEAIHRENLEIIKNMESENASLKAALQDPTASRRGSQGSLGDSSISSLPGLLSPPGNASPVAFVQQAVQEEARMAIRQRRIEDYRDCFYDLNTDPYRQTPRAVPSIKELIEDEKIKANAEGREPLFGRGKGMNGTRSFVQGIRQRVNRTYEKACEKFRRRELPWKERMAAVDEERARKDQEEPKEPKEQEEQEDQENQEDQEDDGPPQKKPRLQDE